MKPFVFSARLGTEQCIIFLKSVGGYGVWLRLTVAWRTSWAMTAFNRDRHGNKLIRWARIFLATHRCLEQSSNLMPPQRLSIGQRQVMTWFRDPSLDWGEKRERERQTWVICTFFLKKPFKFGKLQCDVSNPTFQMMNLSVDVQRGEPHVKQFYWPDLLKVFLL